MENRTRREVARAAADVLIEADRLEEAARVVRSTLEQGLGLEAGRHRHHCFVSRVYRYVDETEPADFHLERCRAGDRNDDEATARAELLAAMADPEATVEYRRELVEHLQNSLATVRGREETRLNWLIDISASSEPVDDAREERLRRQLEEEVEDGEPAGRVDAARQRVQYLLETGRFEAADRILDTRTSLFFDAGRQGRRQWHLLRIDSMIRQLRPLAAFDYIDRALEAELGWSEADRGHLHAYRAMAHLQLGQHVPALRQIRRPREADPGDGLPVTLDELESRVGSSRFGQ